MGRSGRNVWVVDPEGFVIMTSNMVTLTLDLCTSQSDK